MTRSSLRNAALTCATQWQWPVLPGAALTSSPAAAASVKPDAADGAPTEPVDAGPAGAEAADAEAADAGPTDAGPADAGPADGEGAGPVLPGAAPAGGPEAAGDGAAHGADDVLVPEVPVREGPLPSACCSCGDPDCVVPGAHPLDPVLLAATTDARMVRWWWTNRPCAPLILATGGRAPCALSLPALAGMRALAEFDRTGIRLGPVTATATRYTFLVTPYRLEELGDLLYTHDWVPSSLRFHGEGGYVALPPSPVLTGQLRWERPPVAERGAGGAPWLPRMETLLDALVEASATTPDTGSTLAY